MSTDLRAFTEDLVKLYEQELDGEPISPIVMERVTSANLSEGDWWEVMVDHWPHDGDILELSNALEWLQDSPIWRESVPIGKLRPDGTLIRSRRRGAAGRKAAQA